MQPEILKLFEEAIKIGASDLILKPGSPPVYRINQHLVFSEYESLAAQQMYNLLLPVLDAAQQENLQQHFKTSSIFTLNRTITRIRTFIYKLRGGYAGTFRFIPNKVPNIKSLNLPASLENLASIRKGIFLVTGPVGNGKTTTISALTQSINERLSRYIITADKLIEVVYQPVKSVFTQIEVGKGLSTYSEAVSNALRENADVIVLGDFSDKDIVEQAFIASETGHLVLASIQASGSASAIEKIVDLFPIEKQEEIRGQLSQNLIGILSQRLIPSIEYKKKASIAYELLFTNPNIRNIIKGCKYSLLSSTLLNSKENGCISFKESIEKLLKDESLDKDYLRDLLKEVEE
jgi:twitching motility protein PilT